MKRIIALLLTLAMAFSLCACGAKGDEAPKKDDAPTASETPEDVPTIKIGALYPFFGGSATAGPEAQFLIDMAVEMVNAEGGLDALGGAKIEVIYGDTQADGQVALTEFERLVNVEGVNCLIGGYNTAVANTLSQYAIAAQVPMLMSYVAETERQNIRKRQAEGIQAMPVDEEGYKVSKKTGRRFGRQSVDVDLELLDGETITGACERLGISRTTYYRKMREMGA